LRDAPWLEEGRPGAEEGSGAIRHYQEARYTMRAKQEWKLKWCAVTVAVAGVLSHTQRAIGANTAKKGVKLKLALPPAFTIQQLRNMTFSATSSWMKHRNGHSLRLCPSDCDLLSVPFPPNLLTLHQSLPIHIRRSLNVFLLSGEVAPR